MQDNYAETRISVQEIVLLFFSGFLALSLFTNVLLETFHISFYLFEVFLIPFLFFKQCRVNAMLYRFIHQQRSIGVLHLLLLITSILVGIINTTDIFGVITCVRPLIYITVIATTLYSTGCININKIYWLAAGTIAGDCAYIIMYRTTILRGFFHINILAIFCFMIVGFINGNLRQILISSALSLGASFMSGYRIDLLIWTVTLFVGILYSCRAMSLMRKIVVIPVLAVILILAYNNLETIALGIAKLLKLSETTIYRLIERTTGLFTGELSYSDQGRLEQYFDYFRSINDKILISGPIGKSLGAYYFGLYTDTPISFLIDVYGLPLAIIVCLIMGIKGIACFINTIIQKKECDKFYVMSALSFPVFICLIIINGSFLTFVNISVFAGILLSCWISKNGIG